MPGVLKKIDKDGWAVPIFFFVCVMCVPCVILLVKLVCHTKLIELYGTECEMVIWYLKLLSDFICC